jgi:hypothetical protein
VAVAVVVVGQGDDASAQSRCISGWNSPGNGQLDTTYGPPAAFSSGPSLGFVSLRASVVATGADCLVWFDLGHGWAYSFATVRNNESPIILGWSGSGNPIPAKQAGIAWNTCQQDDGTLEAGVHSCPGHNQRVRPRPLFDELEYHRVQAVIGNVQDSGVYPFWLGPRFHGALLEPTASDQRQEVDYPVWDHGRDFTVLVYTYHPRLGATPSCLLDASACAVSARGGPTVLFRQDTETATVVVAYLEPVAVGQTPTPFPVSVLRQVRRALDQTTAIGLLNIHPPTQPASPAPVAGHGVDPLQPRRPLWFGQTMSGLHATVIRTTPPGLGVVRYGSANAPNRVYLATYRPIGARCVQQGCATPPPPPTELLHYGTPIQTWALADAWVMLILAPHPHNVKLPDLPNAPTPAR